MQGGEKKLSNAQPLHPRTPAPIPFHQCTSHVDGNWTVWRCPHCPGYEQRLNRVTSEMIVRKGGSTALHSGMAGAGAMTWQDLQKGFAVISESLTFVRRLFSFGFLGWPGLDSYQVPGFFIG